MSEPDELLTVQPADAGVHIAKLVPTKILDEPAISQIGQELAKLVDDGARKLLLDFARVDHLSSSALGMLITLRQNMTTAKGAIRLCNIRDEILQVFKITGLDKLFDIHPTTTEALASFKE